MDLEEGKEKNKYPKNYAHFDNRVALKNVWNYISNKENIKKHSFYPFIRYKKKYCKFKNGIRDSNKVRDICYSAHIDRYIYSYYSYKLNEIYNIKAKKYGIDEVAIAYRNNLKKNNIDFAKKAIDFIRQTNECYVIISDFKGFFDNLDHKYLKEQLCNLLDVEKLSDDLFAVYKNITKYSTWELEDILKYYNLSNTPNGFKTLNQKKRIFDIREYRKLKKKNINNAKKNENSYGIPQGSAISAVLSNIYMLNADNEIHRIVEEFKGLYMRYSDDIIIVLPKVSESDLKNKLIEIFSIYKDEAKLQLEMEKTQIYKYNNKILVNCNKIMSEEFTNGKNRIDYLGFSFDGKIVTLKDKAISKYYYRMYRKLKTIVKNDGISKNGKRISPRNLYLMYSAKGINVEKRRGNKLIKGNFLTYVKRAKKVWGNNEKIDRSTRRHLIKIRRRLNNT